MFNFASGVSKIVRYPLASATNSGVDANASRSGSARQAPEAARPVARRMPTPGQAIAVMSIVRDRTIEPRLREAGGTGGDGDGIHPDRRTSANLRARGNGYDKRKADLRQDDHLHQLLSARRRSGE